MENDEESDEGGGKTREEESRGANRDREALLFEKRFLLSRVIEAHFGEYGLP